MSTNADVVKVTARELQPGDWVRTGISLAMVDTVKVGRKWVTIELVGKATPLRVRLDMPWTVSRKTPDF